MKHINKFSTEAAYDAAQKYYPNVSYIEATDEVRYMETASHDYSKDYLTFEALESGTFTLTVPAAITSSEMTSVAYSTDDGETWNTTTVDSTAQTITTPTVAQGDTVLWKGTGTKFGSTFSATGNFNASGNVMSLLYGDNFANNTNISAASVLYRLFMNNTKIVSAENMVLPSTTLTQYCYQQMFNGCTALTKAPALPATTLAQSCYFSMFRDTALTTAPALNVTDLNNCGNCYSQMFFGCTSLTIAPTLPATTLASGCYQSMFRGCTSLTSLPSGFLPATTMQNTCYAGMFNGCTSLATVPSDLLPATTLAQNCYGEYSSSRNHNGMFEGCTSLTTAPTLPATTLASGCYAAMFSGCTSLNSITMLATDNSQLSAFNGWAKDVAASGTFTKSASMTSMLEGANGIPSGWTVVDA